MYLSDTRGLCYNFFDRDLHKGKNKHLKFTLERFQWLMVKISNIIVFTKTHCIAPLGVQEKQATRAKEGRSRVEKIPCWSDRVSRTFHSTSLEMPPYSLEKPFFP